MSCCRGWLRVCAGCSARDAALAVRRYAQQASRDPMRKASGCGLRSGRFVAAFGRCSARVVGRREPRKKAKAATAARCREASTLLPARSAASRCRGRPRIPDSSLKYKHSGGHLIRTIRDAGLFIGDRPSYQLDERSDCCCIQNDSGAYVCVCLDAAYKAFSMSSGTLRPVTRLLRHASLMPRLHRVMPLSRETTVRRCQ